MSLNIKDDKVSVGGTTNGDKVSNAGTTNGDKVSNAGTTNGDKVPNIVALEVLEKNGVNIERLKELITKGVGAEFTTYYYYTILRMHCTGLDGEGIKEIVE